MYQVNLPEEIKANYKYAIEKAREDRPRYFEWIKNEIEIAISLINKFDKVYVLGGLGSRLIKATPTLFNQFLDSYAANSEEIDENELLQNDDEIEVLLEYAMSIATSTPNANVGTIPNQEDIQAIYEQLSKIKINMNFWELSAESPNGNDFDHWLRTNIMQDTINVRGDGYHIHIKEVYDETFAAHNGFLTQYYGFGAQDVFDTILKLDSLVYSKVGSPFGATQSHKRLTEWMDEVGQEKTMKVMLETGKHFIMQFTEANPDLYDASMPEQVIAHGLDSVEGYNKIFWVLPKSEKEKKIFEKLSLAYGDNGVFFLPPKFKAFPLNDTLIKLKPLIKENDKYYHFSLNLGFRNIFKITEELIKEADAIYYEHSFRGNSNQNSRDNYIELKVKQLIQKILPNAAVYRSLKYDIVEEGLAKRPELDILAVTDDYVYIVEVKAGQLNQRHRRGELLGLKDRLRDTINEGSYQCQRALKYITNTEPAIFDYVEGGIGKTLTVDKSKVKSYFKISVTFEHFSSISANLKYLIDSGVLSSDLKWTWIVSLYDLMIFADLIQGEQQFLEYLTNRIALYDRSDIIFEDEIDILGYYFENHFPLGPEKDNEIIQIVNFKDEIETYYTKTGVGMPGIPKPKKKKQ